MVNGGDIDDGFGDDDDDDDVGGVDVVMIQ